jgi:hypothetical protein
MAPSKRFHFWKGKAGDSKAEVDKTRAHLEQQPLVLGHSDTLGENSQEQSTEDVKGKSRLEDDPTRFGLKVLVGQPAGRERCVDIIAIHGLNGHYEATWTDRTTGANWLKDPEFIRKDIPNARIQSFGYNSISYFSTSNANVRDFASELLASIKSSRRNPAEKKRPIVFICHSLGGIVFKQVRPLLLKAKQKANHLAGSCPRPRAKRALFEYPRKHTGSCFLWYPTPWLGSRVLGPCWDNAGAGSDLGILDQRTALEGSEN